MFDNFKNCLTIVILLTLFPVDLIAKNTNLTGQIQAGLGYSENYYEKKYNDEIISKINNSNFIITREKDGDNRNLNISYNLCYMFDYIGLGLSTGMIYYFKGKQIKYRTTLDTEEDKPGKYISIPLIFPENALIWLTLSIIPSTLSLNLATGPGLYIFKNTYQIDDGEANTTYNIKGARKNIAYHYGGNAFIELSYHINQSTSYQFGFNSHYIKQSNGIQPYLNIYIGISQRTL